MKARLRPSTRSARRPVRAFAAAWVLGVVGWSAPAQAFAPGEHEAQRSGLERADGVGVRRARRVTYTPPKSAQVAWQRFTDAHPEARWRAQWDADLAVPTRVFGRGVRVPGATKDPRRAEAAATAVLFGHLDLFAPGATASSFELVSNELDPGSGLRTVGFEQSHSSYRVRGGQLSVRIRADRLFVVGADSYPHVEVDLGPEPTAVNLVEPARHWLSRQLPGIALAVRQPAGEAFVLPLIRPEGAVDFRLVREVIFDLAQPIARWSVFMDAVTGAPVAKVQTLRFFDATLSLDVPNRYPQNGRLQVPARTIDLEVDQRPTRTDLQGRLSWTAPAVAELVVRATGENARVSTGAGTPLSAQRTATASASVTVGAPDDELLDAQVAAYYAADLVTRYVERVAPNNRFVRDAQVETNVNLNNSCNAFSDGESINFFRGNQRCENTARLLDVVMHEYGHTVHAQSIIRGVGRQDGALSEGLSDYLAATIAGDPAMGRGFNRDANPLRHLDLADDARWPEDIAGDSHTTGIIYGGALWDLRKALVAKLGEAPGVEQVDRLWYEALRRAVDIPSAFVEVLAADDDDGDLDNGTPNACEIIAAFDRHGLAGGGLGVSTVGPVEQRGLQLELPVQADGFVCPGQAVSGAELEWRLRDRPEVGGTIELAGARERLSGELPGRSTPGVIQYRVVARLESGERVALPRNPADPFYEIYVGETEAVYCTDFETSPWEEGWSHALLEGTDREGADDWQWDVPRGEPGSRDPSIAFSGTRVAGNDLGGGQYNGTYQPNKTNALTSPTVDVSGFETVRLQYRRWLNVEDGFFDQATILANGRTVWTNSSAGRNGDVHHQDDEWRFHDVDLTDAVSDGAIELQFRLSSDGGLEFGGWTLDDICLVGVRAVSAVCGDGVVEGEEQCDDGNLDPGDGCEADCTRSPSPMCGNGILESEETCDDGNLDDGDGCEADCTPTLDDVGTCIDGSKPPCDEPDPGPDPDQLGDAESGCGCRTARLARAGRPGFGLLFGLAALALVGRRRR